jgi:large subunit ribosomal protein L24
MSPQQQIKRHKILIRKGDQVRVMAGKDAGKSGRVLAINPRKNTVVVEHANIIKRHTRPNPSKNIKGGIIEKEAGINASNVAVICGSCGKHTRIGHNTAKDGSRSRACKRCGTGLDK